MKKEAKINLIMTVLSCAVIAVLLALAAIWGLGCDLFNQEVTIYPPDNGMYEAD